ncbi:hypothetical protein EGH82_23685 [Vibrio ponticus]|uniref:Uncharacterized protein n=1 Tax=Vibrio ponticus TaxID=265668 RepID=A0A3N3DN15_9VIBR|nr:hypothetical protein EGH82_23685 [Vibrio ponticus]
MSAIFIHDADSILPDSNMFCLLKTVRQNPRTLECVFVYSINEYFENFTNNNKLLFCQLSKLLKSNVYSEEKHHF